MKAVWWLVALALATAGCAAKEDGGPCAGGQAFDEAPGSCEKGGRFIYEQSMDNKTKKEPFLWDNTERRALVEWSGTVTAGSFFVRITDENAFSMWTEVYDVDGGQSGVTPSGKPGRWIVEIEFANFSGEMDLRVAPAS